MACCSPPPSPSRSCSVWRVIGELPVPGDDWAKYLLYADEIRNHGALLLNNDLWMGWRPFSEDPGCRRSRVPRCS